MQSQDRSADRQMEGYTSSRHPWCRSIRLGHSLIVHGLHRLRELLRGIRVVLCRLWRAHGLRRRHCLGSILIQNMQVLDIGASVGTSAMLIEITRSLATHLKMMYSYTSADGWIWGPSFRRPSVPNERTEEENQRQAYREKAQPIAEHSSGN